MTDEDTRSQKIRDTMRDMAALEDDYYATLRRLKEAQERVVSVDLELRRLYEQQSSSPYGRQMLDRLSHMRRGHQRTYDQLTDTLKKAYRDKRQALEDTQARLKEERWKTDNGTNV